MQRAKGLYALRVAHAATGCVAGDLNMKTTDGQPLGYARLDRPPVFHRLPEPPLPAPPLGLPMLIIPGLLATPPTESTNS